MRRVCTPLLWHYYHPKAVWGQSVDGTGLSKAKAAAGEPATGVEDAALSYLQASVGPQCAGRELVPVSRTNTFCPSPAASLLVLFALCTLPGNTSCQRPRPHAAAPAAG